ncbi:MAG: hypothetical protein ACFFAD_07505 [Candidatus Hermodarchaeota archaeon]
MKSWIGPRTVYIDCYDAFGFLEENYERIMIVMSSIGKSILLKREMVPAHGGRTAETLRCTFETELEPIHVKTMMLGLQYLDSKAVPYNIPIEEEKDLFRFANIEVTELMETGLEEKGRFISRRRQPEKKIELSDLEFIGDAKVFINACRDRLIENLDNSLREKLFGIEQLILDKLQASREPEGH